MLIFVPSESTVSGTAFKRLLSYIVTVQVVPEQLQYLFETRTLAERIGRFAWFFYRCSLWICPIFAVI